MSKRLCGGGGYYGILKIQRLKLCGVCVMQKISHHTFQPMDESSLNILMDHH